MPSQTSGVSVCKLGAGGVLTDPNNDARTWFWAHYYADGEGVLTATSAPDSTWALPTSGITGSQCFYSCRALVGGNGTAWSSSNVGYTYMRIDRAGQTGYLTAA